MIFQFFYVLQIKNFFEQSHKRLHRNDREWLEQHLPDQIKVERKIERFDWKKIDKKLSAQVNQVCCELRETIDKTVRVSITEIIRRTGQKSWIEKREAKLPLTAKVITESLETLEDFMIRKFLWAESRFIEEKVIPRLSLGRTDLISL